jgi:hypothetical protein
MVALWCSLAAQKRATDTTGNAVMMERLVEPYLGLAANGHP